MMDQMMYKEERAKLRATEDAAAEAWQQGGTTATTTPSSTATPQLVSPRRPRDTGDDIFRLNDAKIKEKEDNTVNTAPLSKADLIKEITARPAHLTRRDSVEVLKPKKKVEVGAVILFDRLLDMLTPMCTPLTYEALVDEIFRIKNTCVELEESLARFDNKKPAPTPAEAPSAEPKFTKVPLTSADAIFQVSPSLIYFGSYASHLLPPTIPRLPYLFLLPRYLK